VAEEFSLGSADEEANPLTFCSSEHTGQQWLSRPNFVFKWRLKRSRESAAPEKTKHRVAFLRVHLHDKITEINKIEDPE
jgi:hypothetical protein